LEIIISNRILDVYQIHRCTTKNKNRKKVTLLKTTGGSSNATQTWQCQRRIDMRSSFIVLPLFLWACSEKSNEQTTQTQAENPSIEMEEEKEE